jgi:phosphate starvation-inducible protein PhoH and related proteins
MGLTNMSKRKINKESNNKQLPPARKVLKPKSKNQDFYIKSMIDNDVTFCCGPAGSGKTALAVGLACQYLMEGRVNKIVITRPVVESGRGLGFLPGSLTEKILPYLIPIIEEMKLYLGTETFNQSKGINIIELCPLEYMRGRNFHESFMILDEAQNATFEQIKMFLTRIGSGSKAVINGDVTQTDLDERTDGGLDECMDRLENVKGVAICELSGSDIVRNKIIADILEAL